MKLPRDVGGEELVVLLDKKVGQGECTISH